MNIFLSDMERVLLYMLLLPCGGHVVLYSMWWYIFEAQWGVDKIIYSDNKLLVKYYDGALLADFNLISRVLEMMGERGGGG